MDDGTAVFRGGRNPEASVVGPVPQRYDVVSCYFPEHERPNRPGVKPRPCLVLATRRSHAPGLMYVKVAYGTTAAPDSCAFGEIHIHRPDSCEAAGLHKRTKFNLGRTAVVPFRFEFFRANRSGSVVLGRLLDRDRIEAARMLASARGNRERG
jgi:hypothetical protein